jgi:alanine racemase
MAECDCEGGRGKRLAVISRTRRRAVPESLLVSESLNPHAAPIEATIHTAALPTTWRARARGAPMPRVWAVVKANAYGHGIERCLRGLRGADGFALLDLAEAERVRALGWRGPILLLEGVFEPRDLELCSRLNLWHAVHCDEQIDWLAAHKTQVPHRVFLKMNSGMNRLGFTPAALPRRLGAAERAAAGGRDLAS